MEDHNRRDFELLMSDNGKWPRAVERGSDGNYLLMQAVSAWRTWCAAIDCERQRANERIDVLATHDGKPGRNWHSAGAWLFDGDALAVVRRDSDYFRECSECAVQPCHACPDR